MNEEFELEFRREFNAFDKWDTTDDEL